jgi:hypothetical protein
MPVPVLVFTRRRVSTYVLKRFWTFGSPTYGNGHNALQIVHWDDRFEKPAHKSLKNALSGPKNREGKGRKGKEREGTGKWITDKNYLALQSGTRKAPAAIFAKKSIKIVSR